MKFSKKANRLLIDLVSSEINAGKAYADDKVNVNVKLNFIFGRILDIVGKGENAGYQHFLVFRECFQKVSFVKVIKSRDCVVQS